MPLDGASAENEGRPGSAEPGLSVFQVMPREMYFGVSRATSIDLCVRDLVSFSRFRARTQIFAERAEDGFAGFAVETLPPPGRAATFTRANHVARSARRARPDVIIVQQHLPTAAAIALRLPRSKIILFTHNFQKSYRAGNPLLNGFRRGARRLRYAQLSGLVHVSETCRDAFERNWPSVDLPSCVVTNGLDFTAWHPAHEKAQEILCVCRCAPEKGMLEAAQAMALVLPKFPDWRARFMLSAVEAHPNTLRRMRGALAGLGAQAAIEVQQPFEVIKAAAERAAIALVPSKCRESFGRTALEAHAGAAALISSGSGGLAEISGDAALYLSAVTADAIAASVQSLIANPALRARLADEGAGRARAHFDIRAQAARLDAFCRKVAGSGPCLAASCASAHEDGPSGLAG